MSCRSMDQASGYSSNGAASMTSSETSFSFSQMMEGYDNEFVPQPESRYECPICLLVLREPRQTRCGHRFCRDCIIKSLRDSSNRCPVDNEPLKESDIYPDNFAKREILNFNIKCPNNKDGCDKIFPLGKLQSHLEECPYALTPCPNKCASILQRVDVENHLATACENRMVTCENCLCHIQAKYKQNHLSVCPRVLVTCPHCKEQRIQIHLSAHIQSECPQVRVHCPFYTLGCRHIMVRRSVDEHLASSSIAHMRQLCSAVTYIAQKLNMTSNLSTDMSSKGWPENLTSMLHSISLIPSSMEMQIASHQQSYSLNLNSSHDSVTSEASLSQASPPEAYDLAEGVANSLHVNNIPTSANSFIDGQHRVTVAQYQSHDSSLTNDSELTPSPSLPTPRAKLPVRRLNYQPIAYPSMAELVSPQSDLTRLSLQNSSTSDPAIGQGLQEMALQLQQREAVQQERFSELYTKLAQVEQMNAALVRRVNDLETLLEEKDARFFNGDFCWTINNFSQYRAKLAAGEGSVLHSPPFYSSPWGYKVCIRANIDKTPDTGPNLSLFIHFVKGRNDTFLSWPFAGNITICVLDQNPDSSKRVPIKETLTANPNLAAFQRPTAHRNQKGFGYMNFLSLAAIESGTILVDDTLVVRVQVLEGSTG